MTRLLHTCVTALALTALASAQQEVMVYTNARILPGGRPAMSNAVMVVAGGKVIAIGGADGLDPDLHAKADAVICFGRMTWPHQLVRIMAAEQLYRAVTILSGHPYHRA